MPVLNVKNVTYRYTNKSKTKSRDVLSDQSFSFDAGKTYGIVGKSGAGKTTLLSLLSGLTSPTEGKVVFNGKNLKDINSSDYRAKDCGVIFQSYNLLPQLTAIENIILGMDISEKQFPKSKKEIAQEVLEKVELPQEYADKKILYLSGGEQQRIAIGRSLAINPDIILADEPTGNLDHETQADIIKIFEKLAHKEGKCVIIVTHSKEVAKRLDSVYELK